MRTAPPSTSFSPSASRTANSAASVPCAARGAAAELGRPVLRQRHGPHRRAREHGRALSLAPFLVSARLSLSGPLFFIFAHFNIFFAPVPLPSRWPQVVCLVRLRVRLRQRVAMHTCMWLLLQLPRNIIVDALVGQWASASGPSRGEQTGRAEPPDEAVTGGSELSAELEGSCHCAHTAWGHSESLHSKHRRSRDKGARQGTEHTSPAVVYSTSVVMFCALVHLSTC